MALRNPRDRSPDEPHLRELEEVRRALFRLHKTLVDAVRAAAERESGPVSSGAFLQSLIGDPELAWLRDFSGLIVEIDEARAGDPPPSPAGARALIERVRDLVSSADAGTAIREASRYGEASRLNTDVLLAHLELMSRIEGKDPPDTATQNGPTP
jgi:hypothetical protein